MKLPRIKIKWIELTVGGCCVGVWKNDSMTVKQSLSSFIGFECCEEFYWLFFVINPTSFVTVEFAWIKAAISSSVWIEEDGIVTWIFDVPNSGKQAAE